MTHMPNQQAARSNTFLEGSEALQANQNASLQTDLLSTLLLFQQRCDDGLSLELLRTFYLEALERSLPSITNGALSTISDMVIPERVTFENTADCRVFCPLNGSPCAFLEINTGRRTLLVARLSAKVQLPAHGYQFVNALTSSLCNALRHKSQLEAIENLTFCDFLTGLPNRRCFNQKLRERTQAKAPFSLMVVNVDRFKRVNEVFGFEAGNEVLRRVAAQIQSTADQADCVARVSADEFAVLSAQSDHQILIDRSRQIHKGLSLGFDLNGEYMRSYVSIGISCYPEHGISGDDLLKHADLAMGSAKFAQCGTRVFDGVSGIAAAETLTLEARLERAIDNDEFTLAVQPIFRVRDGRAMENEILLRWEIPGQGRIPPDVFVAIAERIGLANKLDRYVIDKALKETQADPLPIAVNLAAPTLYDEDFAGFVAERLRYYGRPPSRFGIEITERILAESSLAEQSLNALHWLGIQIAVDDFGIGYSSLGLLPELPVNRLKIDKKFLLGKDRNPRYEEVIVGILRMASALGLETVIEGVEDASLMKWLANVGCDYAQGFGLARPSDLIDRKEMAGEQ